MFTSEKITLAITLWILFLFLITDDTGLEIFFVLIFIGILIIKEFTDIYTTKKFKLRMNIFICVFLLIYVFAIAQKILSIINM